MSSRLSLNNLSKAYGGKPALDGVGFSVEPGSLTALTGPSGSGKSTLLRLVAGLEVPDRGTVAFEPLPLGRPPAVLVFQDNLLFPHLRVIDNVTFGPRARKTARPAAEKAAFALLDQLGIGDKARAWPGELSAGQQQRVALARALAAEPAVLLLDEPFANLDRALSLETAGFLRDLQRRRGLTVLLVTHGQEEAFAVADRIATLREGRLVQEGTAEDFRLRPADLEVARFTGEVNVVPGPDGGPDLVFRASETTWTSDPDGDGEALSSVWTGQGFRTQFLWGGTTVTALGQAEPPVPGTRVRIRFEPLKWGRKTQETS